MPVLDRTLPSAEDVVGFELPVFRNQRGANSDLVQKIAADGTIDQFVPCWLPNGKTRQQIPGGNLVEEGEQALWAFRGPDDKLIIGTRKELENYGIHALEHSLLDGFPLAAAEMVSFTRTEARFAEKLSEAYSFLKAQSEETASNWLDTTLFLPAIRQDLAGASNAKNALIDLSQICVVTNGTLSTVYGPESINFAQDDLPSFWSVAKIFGVYEVRYIPLKANPPAQRDLEWQLLGIGGIASFALTKLPFRGRRRTDNKLPTAIVATGLDVSRKTRRRQLLVGVCGSDLIDLRHIESSLQREPEFRYRHAINVRPMGYGTPSPRKSPVSEALKTLPNADVVWVHATHRLRQTGSSGMSGMHIASGTLSKALVGLVACVGNERGGMQLLENVRGHHTLGSIGTWRLNPRAEDEDNVTRLVYNMMAEDVLLDAAEIIHVIWPSRAGSAPMFSRVAIGEAIHEVSYIMSSDPRLASTLVGLAPGVQPARRSLEQFKRFCIALMDGYNWHPYQGDGQLLTFRKGADAFQTILAVDEGKIWQALEDEYLLSQARLLITNRTVSLRMRSEFKRYGVEVSHYSEIGHWLMKVFGSRLVGDRF
ncbi:hypothetical protein [Rhizobium sp. Rhizsp42]|uniref:hypothetical protein n=1 Tax=Rhizobium sp. Rhizsp42 TaxID=3243034 RepID=UPI0039AEFB15